MENICLYDFVADYTKDGIDEDGNIKYRKLGKPVYQTTGYTIQTERRRDSYYYSLLLFVPFCNE